MTTRTASVLFEDGDLRFLARSGSGHQVVLDTAAGDAGMRPAELVPMALAGCTAMDVLPILRKKRQVVTRYEVRASGQQLEDHPNVFTRIDVLHVVDGPGIDVEAVRRAIELSATRYCSVGSTLASGVTEIHHSYLVRDEAGDERMAEVLVIGPHEAPRAVAGEPIALAGR